MLTRLLPLIAACLLLSTEAFAQQHSSADRIFRLWRVAGLCLDATLSPPVRSACIRRSFGVPARTHASRHQAWHMLDQYLRSGARPQPSVVVENHWCSTPTMYTSTIGPLRAVGGADSNRPSVRFVETPFGPVAADVLALFVRHLATTCEIVRPREALRSPPIWLRNSVVAAASPLPTP